MTISSRRGFRFCGLVLFLGASLSVLRAADAPDHVPGRLLVSPRRGSAAERVNGALRAHAAVVRRRIDALNVSIVDVPEESSDAVIQSLNNSGLFEYVERDYYGHTSAATVVPNDPNFTSQWHLATIQAPQAWAMNTGTVTVAVVDSGVDATHPDLAAKLVAGWNFVGNNSATTDILGHGTAVAGTIAAISNNSVGVTGVTWGSKIMPLVVVDPTDFASYSNIAAAIQYAADQGVRIINVSIGGSSPSSALQSAVNYAWNKGSIVFASAMNNSTSTPYYPAACTNVVSVSATDSTDSLASFSNYGNWITVAAPGQNILTTTMGGGYGYWYGTSFSSPITAGVGALILSVNPALSASAVVSLLEQNTDDLGTAGFDNYFGWGRVNANKAVLAARQTLVPVTVAVSPQTSTLSAGQTVQLSATVTGTSSAVAWSISPSVGSIVNGLYTAPASVTSTQTVTVTATVAGVSASAVITLNAPVVSSSSTFTPIRVNAGGSSYTDSQGRTWSTDTGYINGYSWSIANTISNTTTAPVYQTCRYGPAFNYVFAVPNGTYTVNLKFAEVSRPAVGQRVFNVGINGSPVLTNFDIVAAAGGEFMAVDKPFTVTVTGGQINVAFSSGAADWPMVNALEIVSGSTTASTPPATTSFTPILVHAGGGAVVDSSGKTWSADNGFNTGYSWATTDAISATNTPAIYQTCRYGAAFAYSFTVPNGTYAVTLKFAEPSRTAAGQRTFNVAINSSTVLSNFDIFAAAGGKDIAVDKTLTVTATGGQVNIAFTAGNDWPIVSGIQIAATGTSSIASTPSTAPSTLGTAVRIDAGGAAITDASGNTWSADASYANGYTWVVADNIVNTATPALYQTCRYGPAFNYVVSVPNGTYAVTLKFAEPSRTAAGQRTFNAGINGSTVLSNFDIFATAGGKDIAVDKTFAVTVTDGQINIAFTAGNDWAMVNAIEIVPSSVN